MAVHLRSLQCDGVQTRIILVNLSPECGVLQVKYSMLLPSPGFVGAPDQLGPADGCDEYDRE